MGYISHMRSSFTETLWGYKLPIIRKKLDTNICKKIFDTFDASKCSSVPFTSGSWDHWMLGFRKYLSEVHMHADVITNNLIGKVADVVGVSMLRIIVQANKKSKLHIAGPVRRKTHTGCRWCWLLMVWYRLFYVYLNGLLYWNICA